MNVRSSLTHIASIVRSCIPISSRAARRILVAALALGSLIGGPSSRASAQTPAAQPEKPRVAVLPLENRDATEEAESIAEQLRAAFVNAGTFTVIDRTLTGQILKEWSTQQSGLTDQEKAIKVGKLYNVQLIVSGKINKFPNQGWQVSAVLLDAQTGVSLRANTVRHRGDFFSLLDEKVPGLAQALVGPLGASTPVQTTAVAGAASSSAILQNWVPRADLPRPRMRHVALAAADGRIFVFGGRTDNGPAVSVDVFDPAANQWTSVSSLPTAREWLSGAVVNGRMYLIGGSLNGKAKGTLESYDPGSNAWTTLPPMPTARWGAAVSAIEDRIYVVGGRTKEDEFSSTVEMFDARTGQWSSRTPLPRRVAFAAGSAAVSQGIGGTLFVVGGLSPDLGGGLFTRVTSDDSMWMYNPAGNTWIVSHAAPVARTDHAAASLAGRIYSFGGFIGSTLMRSAARHYDVFDVSTGNWETLQMPRARAEHAAVAVNGSIFLIGGAGDAARSVDELR